MTHQQVNNDGSKMDFVRAGVPRDLLRAKLPSEAAKFAEDPRVDEVARQLGLDLDLKTVARSIRTLTVLASFQAAHFRDAWEEYQAWLETAPFDAVRGYLLYLNSRRRCRDAQDDTRMREKRAVIRARGQGDIDVQYEWIAPQHLGTELQAALGYGKTRFTDVLAELRKDPQFRRLNDANAPRNEPSRYSRDGALRLLVHRLSGMGRARAADRAAAIVSYFHAIIDDLPDELCPSMDIAVDDVKRLLRQFLTPTDVGRFYP